MLSYSKKSKCQGCQALSINKGSYRCKLGVRISFDVGASPHTPMKPTPQEKCYKPKTESEMREAQKLRKLK